MNRQTVGEIAAETPAAIRVFERYRIDYCCGGKRPLGEVCQERGISPETLLAELAQAGRQPDSHSDWSHASLASLIAHIVSTHHLYLKSELPLLRARLAKVLEAHGARYPEILTPLQPVFVGLADELSAHLRKEEIILFPAIEEIEAARAAGRKPTPSPFGSVENPIRMMIFEHDNAGNALAEMRRLTQGYAVPPDVCATYRALYEGLEQLETDLHQHIHLENNILFPRALKL